MDCVEHAALRDEAGVWNYLLATFGLLSQDRVIGGAFQVGGILTMAAGLLACGWVLRVMAVVNGAEQRLDHSNTAQLPDEFRGVPVTWLHPCEVATSTRFVPPRGLYLFDVVPVFRCARKGVTSRSG